MSDTKQEKAECALLGGKACTHPAPEAAKQKAPRQGNPCAKTRPADNPYEVWKSFDGSWTWKVLKKWQVDDDKPYARWFCLVVTPFTGPSGDLGDVYVQEIKRSARKVQG